MLTSEVSLKQFHVVLRSIMLIAAFFTFCIFLMLLYYGCDISISVDIFKSSFYLYKLDIVLTPTSVIFSSLVIFITSVVLIYSYYYIGFYTNYKFFIFTTLGFVASMLIVVNFADLFIVMLG